MEELKTLFQADHSIDYFEKKSDKVVMKYQSWGYKVFHMKNVCHKILAIIGYILFVFITMPLGMVLDVLIAHFKMRKFTMEQKLSGSFVPLVNSEAQEEIARKEIQEAFKEYRNCMALSVAYFNVNNDDKDYVAFIRKQYGIMSAKLRSKFPRQRGYIRNLVETNGSLWFRVARFMFQVRKDLDKNVAEHMQVVFNPKKHWYRKEYRIQLLIKEFRKQLEGISEDIPEELKPHVDLVCDKLFEAYHFKYVERLLLNREIYKIKKQKKFEDTALKNLKSKALFFAPIVKEYEIFKYKEKLHLFTMYLEKRVEEFKRIDHLFNFLRISLKLAKNFKRVQKKV